MKSMYPKQSMTQAATRRTSPRKATRDEPSATSRAHGAGARGSGPKAGPEAQAKSASKGVPANGHALEPAAAPKRGRRVVVGRSGVHGKGVFAARPIREGERIIEYVGEVITWREALRRHPHDPDDPHHTFYFHLDDKHVIDGKVHGNAARWINHGCAPNCEADETDGRVFITALRDLQPGDELFYDYRLILDERHTPKVKQQYACRCGAAECRGTMLAPKR